LAIDTAHEPVVSVDSLGKETPMDGALTRQPRLQQLAENNS
jgi:hypothetical protein